MTDREKAAAERRHAAMLVDAIKFKRERPELGVTAPAVVFEAPSQAMLESLAAHAETGGLKGTAIYFTAHGRLHRLVVEDIEPEQRPQPNGYYVGHMPSDAPK